ncbi:23S rRNA pseudouridine(1911/1915/1917) synthase RluD [Pseudoxanthomonas jiangsuensis]|uniref:23S rRNA pseudouridine(1911/1915/1917) synthase RluD n=1 Tax=Pseudoxanthomonas jiangsuensis TaxID=619688 RepID=UPI001390E175|nr:23S rRNA pseudouridine(1911/1915/1917) synthase RluD [Pseudoxanthomonas jiangsuensis]KAF1692175.1 23S rRNA pseudouridine(1911/1915/1917) synthase RluD [Pseudoxanthomonas jiangsuensis]
MPQPSDTPRQAVVPDEAAGRRFDAVLAELFPEYSRSRLAAWIKSGDALLDGAPARPRDPVRGGETVSLVEVAEIQTEAVAEDIPLDVLYEDPHLFVLDKPAGLVVHPGAGNPAGTLVNALLHRDPGLAALPRAGIVHRLDKDTSGVMVVARTLPAHTGLVAQLAAREVHRQYLAVVVGALVSGGTADAAIDRHPRDRLRMAVREDGKDAVTHYRLRERFRAHTALECRLETGRTHQIRVHMQHQRHPIVGDPLYGGPLKLPKGATEALAAGLRGFKRQALHAEVLEFAHPVGGAPVRVEAPLPADMVGLLRILREDTRAWEESQRR